MRKIQFSAQFYNPGYRIKSISGRLGNFIFRSYKDGKITCFYKPRNNGSLSDQSRTNFEALSDQLREIARDLGLSITDINYQFIES